MSQQVDRLYLSLAGTGRVYDITSLTGTVNLPTPLASPIATTAANMSDLAVGYDSPGGNPNNLVFIHSNTLASSSLYKNGNIISPAATLPNVPIGGMGTNNVPGTYFGRVYGFQSNTKTLYPIYPSGSTVAIGPAPNDTDWASGTTFGTDTFFDYENNIYMFLNNSAGTARYLYKIAIATGLATKVVQLSGPASTVSGIQGMAYLKGNVYTATIFGSSGGSANSVQINRININTGASTTVATINIGSNEYGNLDLATVPYYIPFTFSCGSAAFQGNAAFSTGYASTKTLRIPITDIYTPGTYTLNVSGTDITTASHQVNVTSTSTYVEVPVTYNGTGVAGNRTVTVRLGNSSTVCQITAVVEPSFGCTSAMYISQSSTLYNINTTTNPFTFPSIGSYGSNFNSIGLNPLDGLIYGTLDGGRNIVRINAAGNYTFLGPVTGLNADGGYNAGDFDSLGNYYVKLGSNNNTIYRVNLATMTATTITLSQAVNIPDFAYRKADGKLYGVGSVTGRLVSIDLSTTPATVTLFQDSISSEPFGAMFASSTGEIFGSVNSGGFYQFNVTTGKRTLISSSPASDVNDGAHCTNATIVFTSDLYVTKTNGTTTYAPGTTTTYTVVVGNNGPFGVQDATFSDLVPSGIPAGNVSYTATAAGGATTSIMGVNTGSINDVISLPLTGTVTYTITVNIPVSFTGNLTNTARVTSPANSVDPDLSNNTATDTDTQSVCYNTVTNISTGIDSKHGITLQKRTGTANGNWPMMRKSAHTVLESNTQGLVITRVPTSGLAAITSPQEGMMVFDTTVKCLKIYSDFSWKCFSVPACP
ncbi:DUF6923 family protein [Soonwooa purpurea]